MVESKKSTSKILGICIIVIVVLAGLNIWFVLNKQSLEKEIGKLWDDYGYEQWWRIYYQNRSNQLDSWLSGNKSYYEGVIQQKDTRIIELENQIADLEEAKLIKVNMQWTDYPYIPILRTEPYVQLLGNIVNVGDKTAYNCKLRVTLYQGAVIAEDTYITLGTILGENWKSINEKIYYSGEDITRVDIIPIWD